MKIAILLSGLFFINTTAMQKEEDLLLDPAPPGGALKITKSDNLEKNGARGKWCVSKNEETMIENQKIMITLLQQLVTQQQALATKQSALEKELKTVTEIVTMHAYETGRVEFWKPEQYLLAPKGPLVSAYSPYKQDGYQAFKKILSFRVKEEIKNKQ